MYGLGSSFKYGVNSYVVVEALNKYVLASAEAYDEDPGQQAPIGLMASGG